ncbi:MAG: serine/threonine protein kinase [Myxococcales bacterium]|nr:serine/threonine protein kinase [Myxococcales bacterium]
MQQSDKKYRVLRRIGEGGMAEVYSAEMQCQPGYSKRVAVKRVLPHLARNRRFMTMFLDEARLGLLLSHCNIVNVFDVGRADDAYFIVMEYVNGVNLKEVWELFDQRNALMPLEVACAIAVEICRGLDYAHTLTDTQGNPLGVVHHDVNPANVLLSVNGEVKLVDFGLSEAALHAQKVDPDILRGKFGYVSPEAALGMRSDARSDLFAVAIMLYELATGQRLFYGKDDIESLQLARAAQVPSPRAANPYVPASLERVLLKALARDPDDRFQTARSFGLALTEVLFEMGRPVSAFRIGDVVDVVRSHRREHASERAAFIEMMIEEELMRFESLDHSDPPPPPADHNLWDDGE